MDEIHAERDPVLIRAGEWLLELQSPDVSVERVAEWQQWLTASARHRRAYEELQATWRQVDRVSAPAWPSDTEVAADRHRSSQTVTEWRSNVNRRARWPIGVAAAAALAGAGFWAWLSVAPLQIQTPTGQNREVRLSDGSSVSVGAGSLLEVSMHSDRRDVVLERGEAYFKVAKDPSRPFRVRAGNAAIMAVGTAFNVRRADERIVVAVSEGAVDVHDDHLRDTTRPANTRLVAGQRLVLERKAAAPAEIEPVAPQAVASWREGRLQFSGEPLAAVIADVNRYAVRSIVIGDASIRGLRVTGTVSQGNVESWLNSLEKALPIAVITEADGAIRLEKR